MIKVSAFRTLRKATVGINTYSYGSQRFASVYGSTHYTA